MLLRSPRLLQDAAGRWILLMHAWSTACMRFVSQRAAHSVSLLHKDYADQYAYGSRSAQRIGCCRLEMIFAAALHGLSMPVRSAPDRKSSSIIAYRDWRAITVRHRLETQLSRAAAATRQHVRSDRIQHGSFLLLADDHDHCSS